VATRQRQSQIKPSQEREISYKESVAIMEQQTSAQRRSPRLLAGVLLLLSNYPLVLASSSSRHAFLPRSVAGAASSLSSLKHHTSHGLLSNTNRLRLLRGGASPTSSTTAKLDAIESKLKPLQDAATGVSFSPKLDDLYLVGVGVRKKSIIKIYAVSMYASPSVLNALSSLPSGKQHRKEAAAALRNAARLFDNTSNAKTTFVLEMVYGADAKSIASAIGDSLKPRYGGSTSDIQHLESLIAEGLSKKGGQASKGTVFRFDCSEDGVDVIVDGKLQGSAKFKGMGSAFVDVFIDDNAVSPSLVDSCIDNLSGEEAKSLSEALLELETEDKMKNTSNNTVEEKVVSGDVSTEPIEVTQQLDKVMTAETSVASYTQSPSQKTPLDLVAWSRLRVKSDPSSIPISALLSKRYLNVPISTSNKSNNVQLLGLAPIERHNRLKNVYGPNELEQPPERTLMSYIIEQFDDKLVRILLVVACVSAFFGLVELKEEMGEWGVHLIQPLVRRMTGKGSGDAESAPPTSSATWIASQVVQEAKNRLTVSGEGANVEGVSQSDGAHDVVFGVKHILEALVEPIVITTILIINALVGGYQSLNASKGISALKQMQAQKAVIRMHQEKRIISEDGIASVESAIDEVEVDASSLVPGDVVILTVGQKIPADIRLMSVSTSTFTVDEACLTGESDSVPKIPYKGDVQNDEEHNGHVMDDLNEIQEGVGSMGKHANGMLYGGTVITAGKGVGVVVRTGMDTEMGKVRLFCSFGTCRGMQLLISSSSLHPDPTWCNGSSI
jgi:hypothetical protein